MSNTDQSDSDADDIGDLCNNEDNSITEPEQPMVEGGEQTESADTGGQVNDDGTSDSSDSDSGQGSNEEDDDSDGGEGGSSDEANSDDGGGSDNNGGEGDGESGDE